MNKNKRLLYLFRTGATLIGIGLFIYIFIMPPYYHANYLIIGLNIIAFFTFMFCDTWIETKIRDEKRAQELKEFEETVEIAQKKLSELSDDELIAIGASLAKEPKGFKTDLFFYEVSNRWLKLKERK